MIFDEQQSRHPDHYPWTEQFMNSMWDSFWTVRKFTFQSDVQQFKTVLTDEEREMVIRALSAIGQIEIAVKTFWSKLGDNLPHPSIQDLGMVMANVEVIHNKAYEELLKKLDLEHVFEENLKLDFIQNRVKYLKKYTHRYYKNSKKQYLYALILFTLFVENVSLFSQFYIVNWIARVKNVLKDTDQQIKYTRNEENVHALVGVKLINTIREEYPELFDEELEERIIHEAGEAFSAEGVIVDWMVGDFSEAGHKGETLNSEVLKVWMMERINESMDQIGFKRPFELTPEQTQQLDGTEWFTEELLGLNMADFFHTTPTEYAKANQSFDPDALF